MPGFFFTDALSKVGGSNSWDTTTAWFENVPIYATITLSMYAQQNQQNHVPFELHTAETWIETPATPHMVLAGILVPIPNVFSDSTVWMTTDHVKFTLHVQNVTAAAVGQIYDRRPDADYAADVSRDDLRRVLQDVRFAVYEENGTVVGTHREVQLEGGRTIDIEAVRDRFLIQSTARSERALKVAVLDQELVPRGRAFTIDPSSGRAFLTSPD